MKKNFFKAILALSLIATTSAFVVSCDNGDDPVTPVNPGATINPADFKGEITGNVTLDATKTYTMTDKVIVKAGASLTIPAGTNIKATAGKLRADGTVESVTYLLVEQGAKIFINGTAEKPVVFEGTVHKQGHWGGLVVLGKAPSNRSAAGTSTSELGEQTYGGTAKDDNSGVISYVVIKDSGFKYNPEKEFNGLSLFGVGSGTTVSNVFIVDGGDDGIEFFGGNVNASNLVVIGVGDDQVDWTEGYQGTITNVYAARKTAYASAVEPGNRGVEADTQDTDSNTTNGNGASNPTIKNMTLIGNVKGSESQGMKLRAGSNGKFDNVVVANYATGLDLETDRTFTWFTGQTPNITNISFVNVGTEAKFKATTAFPSLDFAKVFTKSTTATGAGSGTALPAWAKGWTGLTAFDVADAGN